MLTGKDAMDALPPTGPPADRLESWKEIAAYLKRDVTTVQRWEKREGMPVHRHVHDRSSSVHAWRTELDGWARSRRGQSAAAVPSPSRPRPRPGRLAYLSLAVAGGSAVLAAALWTGAAMRRGWTSPLAGAAVQFVTDFDGAEQAAAVSRDGRFVAFLSDRDGRTDVWMTELGSGRFYNLTRGRIPALVNPSVRTLGFTPDGSLITFWTTNPDGRGGGTIAIWAVPTLGGQPRPYLDAAECDWSADGTRLVYHTPGPGDPTFIGSAREPKHGRLLFTAAPGKHAHFPVISPDGAFVFLVQGAVSEGMDLWRLRTADGRAERLTRHDSRVSHPVLLDDRTLLYLATDRDGGGPGIYSLDLRTQAVHRVSAPFERYTSLSASADGRRIVATQTHPRETLWRAPISGTPSDLSAATRVPLTTSRAGSPRFGRGSLFYVSPAGGTDAIWRVEGQAATPLWSRPGVRVVGGPSISPGGEHVAFTAEEQGRTRLYTMDTDGSRARVVSETLHVQGAPAWSPDGQLLAVAAEAAGTVHLFTVPAAGGEPVELSRDQAAGPAWSSDGRFVVFSGADIGTTFRIGAVSADGGPFPLREIALTRGAGPLRFMPGRRALVVLRGEIQHKDLWTIDLDTGAERQLTNLPPDFLVRDFDISEDGREVVLDRIEEHSNIVLLDLPRR